MHLLSLACLKSIDSSSASENKVWMGVSSRLILGALTSPAGSLPELQSLSLEKIRNTSQASLGRLPAWYPRKKTYGFNIVFLGMVTLLLCVGPVLSWDRWRLEFCFFMRPVAGVCVDPSHWDRAVAEKCCHWTSVTIWRRQMWNLLGTLAWCTLFSRNFTLYYLAFQQNVWNWWFFGK